VGPLRWPVGPLQLSFQPLVETSSCATGQDPDPVPNYCVLIGAMVGSGVAAHVSPAVNQNF